MQTEIEAKFTNIDKEEIRKKLEQLGSDLIHKERLMKRRVFDFPDARLYKIGGWVRVRDEGDKITLSYKQLNDRTLHGTQEVNLVIDDFANGCRFIECLGLNEKAYQETKRESWKLGDVEIEIDEWPWSPPFMEIEGPTEEKVKNIATQLGFDWSTALYGSVEIVYQKYYDVTEEDVDSWPEIIFTPVPDWLEKKRIKK